MPPALNLPASLLEILSAVRPCFTAPSFVRFCGLAAGLAGQARRRTVRDAAGRVPAPGLAA